MSDDTQESPDIQTQTPLKFRGFCILKDWIAVPNRDSRSVRLIAGDIEIIEQSQAAGFKVKGSESNWFAQITGPTETVGILGCQIRGFHQTDNLGSSENPEIWQVS